MNEYNKLINENFDIADDLTRKTIIALENDESNQLLTTLSSQLYDKIVEKVDKVDFGSIPKSNGDITKVEGFDNTVECLNIMRQIVNEYKEDTEIVDNVLTAIDNIKARKGIFMKAFATNVEAPILVYNSIVMDIEYSVSFLISVCIQYIKDPSSTSMKNALDKTAYYKSRENLCYKQIITFNNACLNNELDNVINHIIKNAHKVNKESYEIDSKYGTTINININMNKKKHHHPFEDDDNKYDNDDIAINGSSNTEEDDNSTVNESITGAIAIGALIVPLTIQGIRILFKSIIPLLRSTTYFFIHSRVKLSDMLLVQGQFIEANTYKIQYSNNELTDEKKDKVIKKQRKIAEFLKKLGNKIAIDKNTSEKSTKNDISKDSKKYKIDDIKNLPVDIEDKKQSVLF